MSPVEIGPPGKRGPRLGEPRVGFADPTVLFLPRLPVEAQEHVTWARGKLEKRWGGGLGGVPRSGQTRPGKEEAA